MSLQLAKQALQSFTKEKEQKLSLGTSRKELKKHLLRKQIQAHKNKDTQDLLKRLRNPIGNLLGSVIRCDV
jgi:hypothetical protein